MSSWLFLNLSSSPNDALPYNNFRDIVRPVLLLGHSRWLSTLPAKDVFQAWVVESVIDHGTCRIGQCFASSGAGWACLYSPTTGNTRAVIFPRLHLITSLLQSRPNRVEDILTSPYWQPVTGTKYLLPDFALISLNLIFHCRFWNGRTLAVTEFPTIYPFLRFKSGID